MKAEWMLLIPRIAIRCSWAFCVIVASAAHGAAEPHHVSTAAPGVVYAPGPGQGLPGPSSDLLSTLENIYKDIHAHPELSMHELRTAGIAAEWLRKYGYEVTEKVGGTGVVGILHNGTGATVLLRADMDALPMKEDTGLPYASTKTGDGSSADDTAVAHSCGHDMHVTWLMGVTRILSDNRDKWHGTIMAVFQPGEETGEGAKAMVADGLAT